MHNKILARKTVSKLFGAVVCSFVLSLSSSCSEQKQLKYNEREVPVRSKTSLIHLASVDSLEITDRGVEAAKLMMPALEKNDKDAAKKAIAIYDDIITKENFGGDYTALKWFAEYILANDADKKTFLSDGLNASYFELLATNNYANLKEYLERKYRLKTFKDTDTSAGRDREAFLEDFIRFNNPRRETWEKTSKIIEALKIKEGAQIADVGSGPGYYTFQFAKLAGDKGKVFAIDTVADHLKYVSDVSKKVGLNNIQIVNGQKDNIQVGDGKVDMVFMCSLYHVIYTVYKEGVKDKFITSIRNSLKPDGTFVVVDNSLVESGTLPYQGPHIAKELIVGQLENYGFRLVEEYDVIPQRYVLVFKKHDL
jgi:ubiquinone/menaquinone biosynthesis C-methylase UbiE